MDKEKAIQIMQKPEDAINLSVQDFVNMCSYLNINDLMAIRGILFTEKMTIDTFSNVFLKDAKEKIANGAVISDTLQDFASKLLTTGVALENLNNKIEFIQLFIYDERTPEYFKKKRIENQQKIC